ncbi:MAG: hypothetical protein DRJ42_15235 [Deltaproteobacteria bacterium]|nr:MAG: hypothetical protein DRJ42_15235 [Deltaproteobacteria bacterium]
MRRFALAFWLGILVVVIAPRGARAQMEAESQAPSPRRATGMTVDANLPAVLLEDDVAWEPHRVPLSVCTATRCAPVVDHERCTVPTCPGPGNLLRLGQSVGDVSSWPTSVGGFNEEIAELTRDPHFSGISYAFGYHPDLDDDGDDDEGVFLHTGLLATAGTLGAGGGALLGATGSIGVLVAARGERLYDNERMHETLFFGDRMRLMVRGGYLAALSSQSTDFIANLGLAFEAENRIEGSAWAVPTLISVFIPELGATFREGASPGFYARFSMPIRLHVTKRAGIELRFSVTAVERIDDQGVEGLLTFSLGGFRQ